MKKTQDMNKKSQNSAAYKRTPSAAVFSSRRPYATINDRQRKDLVNSGTEFQYFRTLRNTEALDTIQM